MPLALPTEVLEEAACVLLAEAAGAALEEVEDFAELLELVCVLVLASTLRILASVEDCHRATLLQRKTTAGLKKALM